MHHTGSAVRRLFAIVIVAAAILGSRLPAFASAQSTSGTLIGIVYEAGGAPVSGAIVLATSEINGNRRSTVTIANGTYRLPFMPPGRYTIRASKPGYSDNQITGFPIPLNSTTNLVPPITLGPVGAGVQPAAPSIPSAASDGERRVSLVNTNDVARRGNFDRRQVEALPLGGTTETRTFDELALLVSGVAPPPYVPGVRGPGVGFGIGTAGQFSVNGTRARSNNFTVDGSDNNDPDVGVRRQGFVALVPQSIESVQEFQLSTLLWDAESGRNAGAQVNAVSRVGSNRFHGQVYGFFTDSSLNARNAFDYVGGASRGENPYTRVQAGFVLGGPIVPDRTQFFTSYERLEINAALEQHFATPRLDERRFLGLPQFGVRHDPTVGGVRDFITEAGATPIGQAVLSLYPLPNNPAGPFAISTYSEVLPASGNGNIFSFKVTHSFGADSVLNARYNLTDDDRILPSVKRAIRSTIGSETRTQNVSVIYDHSLGSRLFGQFRFSYGRTNLAFPEYPTSPLLFSGNSATRPPRFPDDPGDREPLVASTGLIGELVIQPFSPVGIDVYSFPQGRTNQTFQAAGSLFWTLGDHSVKFGADVRRNDLDSFQDRNYRPLVLFNNGLQFDLDRSEQPSRELAFLPGIALASIGLPSSILQSLTVGPPDSRIDLQFYELNLFVNDSWRIRPNLTLEMGLRFEYNTVPRDATEKIENGIGLRNLPSEAGGDLDTGGRTSFFMRAADAYRNVLGDRDRIYDSDANNFGPHLGIAWDPRGDGRLAIRAGYGVHFDAVLGTVVSQSRNVFPEEVPINLSPSFVPFRSLGLPLPSRLVLRSRDRVVNIVVPGTVNQLGGNTSDFIPLVGEILMRLQGAGGLAYSLPSRDLATPYVQQWHLTIESEFADDYLLSVAYVGTKGSKLTRLTSPNNGPGITPVIPITTTQSGLTVVSLDRPIVDLSPPRPNSGVLGAYTIYENSASSNYHALQVETRKRFTSGFLFSGSYTWSHAIDDVSDVFPIAGAPLIAQDSSNLALERGDANFDLRHRFAGTMIWDLPFFSDPSDGSLLRQLFGDWQVSAIFQAHTGQPFTLNVPFDANLDGNLTDRPTTTNGLVFFDEHGARRLAVASGTSLRSFLGVGYVGRNTVRADGFANLDLAARKEFRFTENHVLLFRVEVFNALNRTNFGLPNRIIGNPGFGRSFDTVTPARVVQFAIKYQF